MKDSTKLFVVGVIWTIFHRIDPLFLTDTIFTALIFIFCGYGIIRSIEKLGQNKS